MNITVILCTSNRCQVLKTALESIAASELPPSVEWEVLVVDNNSRDRTHEVVEELCCRHPGRFRYILEPRQGKSFALNTGVGEARGAILAFTDDDVIVAPTWLWNLTKTLFDGSWAGTGGRTLPLTNVSLPRWLSLDGPYGMGGSLCAYFNLGESARELDRAPYGANMALQKRVFKKCGYFRADLGPGSGPAVPRLSEDTEFGLRLMAAGEHLRYEPSAIVYHPVPKDRITKRYLLDWYFVFGQAMVRQIPPKPSLWGIPRIYLMTAKTLALRLPARTLIWILALNPQRRFYGKAEVWKTVGEITEAVRRCF
jgi:glucosyl-dolichyl phosphate glucuronosyltransferase